MIVLTLVVTDYRIRTGRDVLSASSTGSIGKPQPRSSSSILARAAQSNFRMCAVALSRQAKYWNGVGWIAAVVDKLGGQRSRISLKAATEGVATFVSPQELASRTRLMTSAIALNCLVQAILKRLAAHTGASPLPVQDMSRAGVQIWTTRIRSAC